jgi:hypothetical protein
MVEKEILPRLITFSLLKIMFKSDKIKLFVRTGTR